MDAGCRVVRTLWLPVVRVELHDQGSLVQLVCKRLVLFRLSPKRLSASSKHSGLSAKSCGGQAFHGHYLLLPALPPAWRPG